MKLKTLVGSMMVLGLVTTGVMANSKASQDATKISTDVADQVYSSSVDRNQDNAYPVRSLSAGQIKVSGLAKVDSTVRANRHNTDLSKNNLSANNEELYFDALVNDFTTLHLALAYDYNNVINHLDGSEVQSVSTATSKHTSDRELYFSEAYAKMFKENFFVKVGQQYINFGSTKHDAITEPVTQTLSNTDQLAATFGVQNLLGGLYASVAFYKGANIADGKGYSRSNGYNVDIGYALHGDTYSANMYADYISNMADIDAINNTLANTKIKGTNVINKRIPGMAVHAGVTMGPLQLLADYVTALQSADARDYEFNKSSAEPSAYSVEASYNFMPKQTATIGIQGTKKAFGLKALGAETFLPKERLLVAYTYQFTRNLSLQAELTHDKAYASSVSYGNKGNEGNPTTGSGKEDNMVLARLTVAF